MPSAPRFTLLASRDDGLTMRLNTLLDARILADLLDADFTFQWSEPALPPADQHYHDDISRIFEPDFLARFRRPLTETGGIPRLSRNRYPQDIFDAEIAAARASGLLLIDRPFLIRADFPFFASAFTDRLYSDTFDALGFTPPLRAAIALARSVQVTPGAAAIHIRSGDIVHGTHAHHPGYIHKAPSIFEIETLLARLRAEGRTVWLVGQEPALIDLLAARDPGIRSPHQLPQTLTLDPVQRVLFDVVLLSRMEQVHGGNSGLTQLARRLGNNTFVDLYRKAIPLNPADFLHDPLAAPLYAPLPSALKAHSYYKLIYLAPPDQWTANHRAILSLMRKWRPDSRHYDLLDAAMAARAGDMDGAEAAIRRFLSAPPGDLGITYSMLRLPAYFPVAETAPLAQANPAVYPATGLIAALRAALTDPTVQTTAAARHALAALPSQLDPALRALLAGAIPG